VLNDKRTDDIEVSLFTCGQHVLVRPLLELTEAIFPDRPLIREGLLLVRMPAMPSLRDLSRRLHPRDKYVRDWSMRSRSAVS
jgi:hypothetical protein